MALLGVSPSDHMSVSVVNSTMGKRKAVPDEAQEEGAGLSAYERERQLLCGTFAAPLAMSLTKSSTPPSAPPFNEY